MVSLITAHNTFGEVARRLTVSTMDRIGSTSVCVHAFDYFPMLKYDFYFCKPKQPNKEICFYMNSFPVCVRACACLTLFFITEQICKISIVQANVRKQTPVFQ